MTVKACSILIVDDDTDFAEGLADLLELQGHSFAIATEGRTAVQLARDELRGRDWAPEAVEELAVLLAENRIVSAAAHEEPPSPRTDGQYPAEPGAEDPRR